MRRERVAWWRLNGGNGANLGIAQSLDGLFHMQSPWEKMDDLGIEVPLQCEAPSVINWFISPSDYSYNYHKP